MNTRQFRSCSWYTVSIFIESNISTNIIIVNIIILFYSITKMKRFSQNSCMSWNCMRRWLVSEQQLSRRFALSSFYTTLLLHFSRTWFKYDSHSNWIRFRPSFTTNIIQTILELIQNNQDWRGIFTTELFNQNIIWTL